MERVCHGGRVRAIFIIVWKARVNKKMADVRAVIQEHVTCVVCQAIVLSSMQCFNGHIHCTRCLSGMRTALGAKKCVPKANLNTLWRERAQK